MNLHLGQVPLFVHPVSQLVQRDPDASILVSCFEAAGAPGSLLASLLAS